MGRTSTANRGNNYNKALNLFFGSWESNPASRGAKSGVASGKYLVYIFIIFDTV
jgi:hypothetical protein